MQWYYAINNQRLGPVSQADLERLAAEGTIKPDTLVWRAGMAQWETYAKAVTAATATPPLPTSAGATSAGAASGDTAVCSITGRTYLKSEMVQHNGQWIGPDARDGYFARLKEQTTGLRLSDEVPAGVPRYGGFWFRVLAAIIDIIAINILERTVAVFVALPQIDYHRLTEMQQDPGAMMNYIFPLIRQMMLVSLLVSAAYEIICVATFSSTPGKIIFGMKVLCPDGKKITLVQNIGRYLLKKVFSTITLGLAYIVVGVDREKRGLHDMICGTRVIKTRSS